MMRLTEKATHLAFRSSRPVVFQGKGVLKICSKFIEITLRHGCSPVNLLHNFRTPFSKNTYRRLVLRLAFMQFDRYERTKNMH